MSELSEKRGANPAADPFDRFLDEWSRRDFLRGMGGAAAFAAFMAGGAEFLAACGGGATTATQNVKVGGHIVEGSISDIANITPIFSNDTASNTVRDMIYDRLITVDAQGNLLPNIATAVPKVDSDQLTYKMQLRQDVKWSDGMPVTSDDVLYTYQVMWDPKYKATTSRYRAQLEQWLASVTAPDKFTVVFKTTSPYAPFLISFLATIAPIPKHVWEKLQPTEINGSEMNQVPTVGNGPFLPVKWDKGAQYQLKRNDAYFRGKANLDSYIYKVVPDAVAVANQLKTGEIDVGQPDKSQWDSLATAANITRLSIFSPSFDYYIQNLDPAKTPKAAIFGDLQVRKALLMALNRKQIADKVYFGQADPADSSVSSAQWVHVHTKTQYPYDVAKAEQMLDAAGWVKGADGVRAKGGVRMEWELRTNVGNKVRETLITVLADQWKVIGANVATKPVQFPQLVTQLSQSREFEMILLGISEGLEPDTTQLWSSKSIGNGALNGAAYKNPTVDNLLDTAAKTFDHDKRKGLYQQIQEILMEDLPAPLVTFPRGNWGVSKRVKNFNVGPWNQSSPRPWMKDVFVVDGK